MYFVNTYLCPSYLKRFLYQCIWCGPFIKTEKKYRNNLLKIQIGLATLKPDRNAQYHKRTKLYSSIEAKDKELLAM